jgi:uncharacterized DUF497 family protein
MRIDDIIWLDDIVDKIERKHRVSTDEVEDIFLNRPRYRLVERGKIKGEDLYHANGQTEAGRYLLVVFIYKTTREALIISARDMNLRERKNHVRK